MHKSKIQAGHCSPAFCLYKFLDFKPSISYIKVMKGTPITVIQSGDLTQEEMDYFWDKGICLDDYDYMLVCPSNIIKKVTHNYEGEEPYEDYEPSSYTFERLLTGCCSNKWYKIEFRGKKAALGIAYHA